MYHHPPALLATIAANGGYTHSEEIKAKIRAANQGRTLPPVTDETRAKLSAALTGKKRFPEAIAKMQATCARKRAEREERKLAKSIKLGGQFLAHPINECHHSSRSIWDKIRIP